MSLPDGWPLRDGQGRRTIWVVEASLDGSPFQSVGVSADSPHKAEERRTALHEYMVGGLEERKSRGGTLAADAVRSRIVVYTRLEPVEAYAFAEPTELERANCRGGQLVRLPDDE